MSLRSTYLILMVDGPRSFKEISRDLITKPRPSQLQVDEQYDACLDLVLRRFVYGSMSGAAGALLLFRSPTTRWATVAFGAGAGLGSAYTDALKLLGDFKLPSLPKWPGS